MMLALECTSHLVHALGLSVPAMNADLPKVR
jgi:hypothetical protein